MKNAGKFCYPLILSLRGRGKSAAAIDVIRNNVKPAASGRARERPPRRPAANCRLEPPGGLFPHPFPSPEGRGRVGSLMRFLEGHHGIL